MAVDGAHTAIGLLCAHGHGCRCTGPAKAATLTARLCHVMGVYVLAACCTMPGWLLQSRCSLDARHHYLLCLAGQVGPSAVPYYQSTDRTCPVSYSSFSAGGEVPPPNGGNDFFVPGLGLHYLVRWVTASTLSTTKVSQCFQFQCFRGVSTVPACYIACHHDKHAKP